MIGYLVYFRPKGLTFSKLVLYTSSVVEVEQYKKDRDYEVVSLCPQRKEKNENEHNPPC
jgi:hypothetical protein